MRILRWVLNAGVAQWKEASRLEREQCQFESDRRYYHALSVQSGVDAWLSTKRTRVQIPHGALHAKVRKWKSGEAQTFAILSVRLRPLVLNGLCSLRPAVNRLPQ